MEKFIKTGCSRSAMPALLERLLYSSLLFITLHSASAQAQKEAAEEMRSPLCGTVEQCTQQGSEKYREGSFGDAINNFKEALTMDPLPEYRATLHLNLAACYKDLGEPGLAIDQLLRYLKERPENSGLPDRDKIDQSLQGLHLYEQGLQLRKEEQQRELQPGEKRDYRKAIESLEKAYELASARSSLGALLRDLGVTYELAGNYKLAAENYEGYLRELGSRARDREMLQKRIESLREREREAELPPITIPPPVPPAPSFWETHRWSIITAGGAAALGLGTIVSRLDANNAYADLRDRCNGKALCSPADAEEVKGKDRRTMLLGISSLLMAGAAAVLYYFELPEPLSSATIDADGVKVRF